MRQDLIEDMEYLMEHPERIYVHWSVTSPLFAKVGKGPGCGCLTQLRESNYFIAFARGKVDDSLKQAIVSDERIPKQPSEITVDHLPLFAEWQQFITDYESGLKTIEQCPKP